MSRTTAPDPLAEDLQAFVQPLVDLAGDPDYGADFFEALGFDPAAYRQLVTLFGKDTLLDLMRALVAIAGSLVESPPKTLPDFARLAERVARVLGKLANQVQTGMPAVLGLLSQEWDEFVSDLLGLLGDIWLAERHPLLRDSLVLLGFLRYRQRAAIQRGDRTVRLAYRAAEFRWADLAAFAKDPGGYLEGYYVTAGLADATAARALNARLFPHLEDLVESLGGSATLSEDRRELTAWVLMPGRDSDLGCAIRPLAANEQGPGVALVLKALPALEQELGDWTLRCSAEGTHGDEPRLTLTARGIDGWGYDRLAVQLELLRSALEGAPLLRLGGAEGTRLELGGLGVTGRLAFGGKGLPDYQAGIALQGMKLVVAPGDGDGFLKTLLPAEGVSLDMAFRLLWSNRTGLHLDGGGGLEVSSAVRRDLLGILSIRKSHLALGFTTTGLSARAGVSADVRLGPVQASVEKLGVEAALDFGGRGLALRLAPPTGVGLAIDAGSLTGAGHLAIDAAAGRYSGALVLEAGQLGLAAVGLLETRLPPDGRDGFSLLVLIAARFPGIPIGFGFTLEGVGGLLGVHRTLVLEQLRKQVLGGGARKLLFPDKPGARPGELVSALSGVFPPARDRFVVAPLVEFGWGSPQILEGMLAVVLELPEPVRLVLVGALRARLPQDQPTVIVNLDVLGVLDLEKRTLAIDARLFDSRVVLIQLSGDAALRLCWGAEPNFALSVGGLHPRFRPPPQFPKLRRVTLALGDEKSPRLSLQAYLAITSNSLQVGARADLYLELFWDLRITGSLAFDALIIFEPFRFELDLAASLALAHKRTPLFAIELRGHLDGPEPWHLRGFARFTFVVECKAAVEARFGRPRPPRDRLAGTEVWPLLQAVVQERANWTATAPARSAVGTRKGAEAGFDPGATLRFRQQRVPLNRRLERFGAGPVAGPDRFDLARVGLGGEAVQDLRPVREPFAAAQFENLGDDQKLSRPAFEQMDAGFALRSEALSCGGARPQETEVETIRLHSLFDPPTVATTRAALDPALAPLLARTGAAARAARTLSRTPALCGGGRPAPVSLGDDTCALVERGSGKRLQEGLEKGAALGAAGPGTLVIPHAELEETA